MTKAKRAVLVALRLPLFAGLIAAAASTSTAVAQQGEAEKSLRELEKALGPAGRQAIESLMSQPRGYVGVQMLNLTDGLRKYFGVERGSGVLIAEVNEGSPARSAGLEAGDVIVAVNGSSVGTTAAVSDMVGASTEWVRFETIRRGQRQTVQVQVEQRKSIVIKLSPSLLRQRMERDEEMGAREEETRVTKRREVESDSEETLGSDLDLAADQLALLFSGDDLKRKMQRLEELDLKELEERIKILESELTELERQIPDDAKAKTPPN